MPQSDKVYVIDDDPAMRDSLDFLLGSAGLNVRLFDSAQAFLNELPKLAAAAWSRTCACPESTAWSCCASWDPARENSP